MSTPDPQQTPRPLRFPDAATIMAHVPAGPLREAALEVRRAADATEAAGAKYHDAMSPARETKARSIDAAAESAALALPEWDDPGLPGTEALAAERHSAHREYTLRAGISDRLAIRWTKALLRDLDVATEDDRAALAKAHAKIASTLAKLRPELAEADARAQRIEWLRWIASNRLDGPPPRWLAPERLPAPAETLTGLLDRMLGLAKGI